MFVNLTSGLTSKSFTYGSGLTAGGTYAFRVMARNSVGFIPFSAAISILVAQGPSTPIAPTTSISGSNVIVNWTAPYTGATRITSYLITIRASNGTYLASIDDCNGAQVIVLAS